MNNLQHTDNVSNGIEIWRIITDKPKKQLLFQFLVSLFRSNILSFLEIH